MPISVVFHDLGMSCLLRTLNYNKLQNGAATLYNAVRCISINRAAFIRHSEVGYNETIFGPM